MFGIQNKRKKYKITFYRLSKPNWFMICTRTPLNCYKIAFYHLLKGHAVWFTIKPHHAEIYTLSKTTNN